ncbi:MAG: hypothetical protein IT228_09200 [Flavobacteriales bacterium]|nr:hypothetical protein [Flavobacteriales bacterium]MCC6577503.1 hypothetical protein [Flavobacteriales bacterium]NUQ14208.1 hypothetical protein [Flavobacteriales bacterium]
MRLFPLIAGALLAPELGAQLLFDRITAADGLPNEEVHALFEDRDGFIWAGTADGLARLEGTRVRVFHHDHNDTASLAHDQVRGIAQDAAGTLWFATMDGLSRFDAQRATFTNLRITAAGTDARQANRMLQVLPLGDTLLWVVTEAGLYRHDIRSARFRSVQGRPAGEGPAGMVNAAGAVFWDAPHRTLWVGTHKGLASWDANTGRWTDHRNSTEEPWAGTSSTNVPVVHGDSLWFLRNAPYTLCAYDLRRRRMHVQPDLEQEPNRFTLRAQGIGPDGTHWLCTWTHRVFRRRPHGNWHEVRSMVDRPGAMPSTRVSALLFVRKGETWFATAQGIAALRPTADKIVPLYEDPDGRMVSALGRLGKDTLLVGSAGGGVSLVDLRTGERTAPLRRVSAALPEELELANFVRAFGTAYRGMPLVCTSRGLALLDVRGGALRPMQALDAAFPQAGESTFTFAERADGAFWFGTWSRGLWRLDEGSGDGVCIDTVAGPYGALPGRMMLSWLTDRSGGAWVGMNDGGGLAHEVNGRFQVLREPGGGHVGGVVRSIAEGPDGRIWLGTHERGILVYDRATGGTRYYTRRDGLPATRIHALLFTRDGTLWAATAGGFAFMEPGTATFRTPDLPAGLQEGGAYTLQELADGRLALTIGDRVLLYDPAIGPASVPPHPVFTGHRINDLLVRGAPGPLELTYDRKALSLELGTVGHHFGPPPQFRYRLADKDTGWYELGRVARIDLFDLAPDRYHIQVQASADGVHWSTDVAAVEVAVRPPFHATWWFRSLMALLAVLAAVAGSRVHLAIRLRRQREAFEREQAVLAERMRIASDMHDDLGAGLSALKLRSEMALRMERDPSKRDQLGALARTAGELIGSMRQIIWTMNADQGSVADLFAYTGSYARKYCDENRVALTVVADTDPPAVSLSAEQRRNVFLVVKEALHNIVKHAAAHRAELRMRWDSGAMDVLICDDGPGWPANPEATEGNGLRNMRRRIAALGGTIDPVRDGSPLPGACLHFRVPVAMPPNLRSIDRSVAADDLRGA